MFLPFFSKLDNVISLRKLKNKKQIEWIMAIDDKIYYLPNFH